MTLVLRYIARSDRGLVRSNNEDSFYAGPRLLALADGMGGHAAGEVASQLVIRALSSLDDDEPGGDLLGQLDRATRAGNEAIAAQVQESPDLDGMGTTLTAILFAGSRIGLCHIGDSRGYMYRDGALTQITRDDTFVQTLVDEGRITAEQAHSHPQRSLIMRALTGSEVEPTLTVREARAGDRYMLCSDGLSDVVSEETLAETLGSIADPKDCADRLIELALRGGGPDNVTVVLADVVDTQYGDSRPIVGGAAGGNEEVYTPDPATAAGRAAALRPPPAEPQRPTVLSDEPVARPKSKWRRWAAVGTALLLVVALVVGVFVLRAIVRSNYYVAADAQGDVLIYQGSPEKVFFLSMSSPVSRVCVENLDQEKPTYTFVSAEDSCEFPLNVDDLVSGPAQTVKNVMIRDKNEQEIEGLVTNQLTFRCDDAPSAAPPSPGENEGPEASPRGEPTESAPAPAPRPAEDPAPGIPQQGATESVAPQPGAAPAPDPRDDRTSCRQVR